MVQADVQEKENLSVRTTFHVSPTMQERIDRAVFASPWDQPDFLRHWLEDALRNLELAEFEGTEIDQQQIEELPLAVQVAALQAENDGLRRHTHLLNERLGLADAQNIDLNSSLKISLGTVDRVTRALPAAPSDEQQDTVPDQRPLPEAYDSERAIANQTGRRSFLERLRLTRRPKSRAS